VQKNKKNRARHGNSHLVGRGSWTHAKYNRKCKAKT
jgi:hypothetical protein